MKSKFKITIVTYLVITLIFGQSLVAFEYLFKPQPAKAFLGIGDISFDFNTEIGNPYDIAKDIAKAAVARIATDYANKFLSGFMDKLLDKYKIRNYLYYDKLLTDFYANQYIASKVSDPDLRNAFFAASELYSYDFTGANADPNAKAAQKQKAIQKLQEAKKAFYYKNGGVDESIINHKPAGMSDYDYYQAAMAYANYPPSFAGNEVDAQFMGILADASSASDQEIRDGKGMKASRSLVNVSATGSEGLNKAISVINNPAGYINDYLNGALTTFLNKHFNSSNSDTFSAIGSALGNMIFNKLQLNSDDSSDVIDETGLGYTADDGSVPTLIEIDSDKDGIPDGTDNNNDGKLDNVMDTCFHGGSPVDNGGCQKSSLVGSSPYFNPLCRGIDQSSTAVKAFLDFAQTHIDQITGIGLKDFKVSADAVIWSRRAQLAFTSVDNLIGNIQNYNNPKFDDVTIVLNRYTVPMDKEVQSLLKDQDLDSNLPNIIAINQQVLKYLEEVKIAIAKCENPNVDAAAGVTSPFPDPVPVPVDPNNPPADNDPKPGVLACYPQTQTAASGARVTIFSTGGDITSYTWTTTDGDPMTDNDSEFDTRFGSQGTHTATVTSAGETVSCQVVIP